MPHHRFTVSGDDIAEVDRCLREARVGVVGGSEASTPTASGLPAEQAEIESIEVIVSGSDRDEAERSLREHLPAGASIVSAGS